MYLPPDEMKAIITPMKRAHGHLASVIRMLEEGSECEDGEALPGPRLSSKS